MSSSPFKALLTSATLIASFLISGSHSHVVLESPRPFSFNSIIGPSNPISSDGSDFPCQRPPGNARLTPDGDPTVMTIGEPQTLKFRGRAVHGGGSCQLALTTDQQPTKDSEWKVIHSIEGGCPARNQKGNLGKGEVNKDAYEFVIPGGGKGGIGPGNYTFAWTWVPRIGRIEVPEFYMLCAPITVVEATDQAQPPSNNRETRRRRRRRQGRKEEEEEAEGGGEKQSRFPALFLANMGESVSGTCTTRDALKKQVAIAYPDPGESVERAKEEEELLPQTCDGNPRARRMMKMKKNQD